jgi:hypothetical protein
MHSMMRVDARHFEVREQVNAAAVAVDLVGELALVPAFKLRDLRAVLVEQAFDRGLHGLSVRCIHGRIDQEHSLVGVHRYRLPLNLRFRGSPVS